MEGNMKAQVYYKPEDMKLENVPIPKINENQILIRVRACGVCGSDVVYYYGKSPLETSDGLGPLILGHEFAGDIVEMGRMAEESGLFAVGDRVLANPVQQCGVCPNCKRAEVNLCVKPRTKGVSTDGAFAEYTVMDMTHVYKIPDHISYEEAALCEPLACACYGVKKLDVQLGDFTVIYGPGAIGLMMLQLIKARGAGRVVMVGHTRLRSEKSIGTGCRYRIQHIRSSVAVLLCECNRTCARNDGRRNGKACHRADKCKACAAGRVGGVREKS